jgi:hypothetical protein
MDIYTIAPLLILLMTYSVLASRVGRLRFLIGAGIGPAIYVMGLWYADWLALNAASVDATSNVNNFYSDQSNLVLAGYAVWPLAWALLLALLAFVLRKVLTGETRRTMNSLVLGLLFLVLSTGVGNLGVLVPPLAHLDNVMAFFLGFASVDVPPGLSFYLFAMPDPLAQAALVLLATLTLMLLIVGVLRARKG